MLHCRMWNNRDIEGFLAEACECTWRFMRNCCKHFVNKNGKKRRRSPVTGAMPPLLLSYGSALPAADGVNGNVCLPGAGNFPQLIDKGYIQEYNVNERFIYIRWKGQGSSHE